MLNDFYTDDLPKECDILEEAILLSDQIVDILYSGCLNFQEWASNGDEFISHVKTINPTAILKVTVKERKHLVSIGVVPQKV